MVQEVKIHLLHAARVQYADSEGYRKAIDASEHNIYLLGGNTIHEPPMSFVSLFPNMHYMYIQDNTGVIISATRFAIDEAAKKLKVHGSSTREGKEGEGYFHSIRWALMNRALNRQLELAIGNFGPCGFSTILPATIKLHRLIPDLWISYDGLPPIQGHAPYTIAYDKYGFASFTPAETSLTSPQTRQP